MHTYGFVLIDVIRVPTGKAVIHCVRAERSSPIKNVNDEEVGEV